ncbi:MAG TPA: hypothetical protein VLE49_13665 [Anaerolineales bacterium]|nr:hypothetical protein [Anaerolineales bacterium]
MKSYTKYWQNAVAIMVLSGLLFSPATASAAGNIAYEQAPGHFGGFDSQFSNAVPESQRIVVADEFQLDQPTFITTVTWWGSPRTFTADTFTIRLYADNAGQPGALLQSFEAVNTMSETGTGDFVNPPDPEHDFEGIPEVQFSFDLPTAFLAEANTRYWLSIFTVPAFDEVAWLWEVSPSLVNLGVQRSVQSSSGPWEPFLDNTAFQLQGNVDTRPLTVEIDIRPGSFPNAIHIKSKGKIPVAILSSATFDAPSQVDQATLEKPLTFGRTGDEQSLLSCSPYPQDVNGDGLLDLVCNFATQATGFQLGDIKGVLKGKTLTGRSLIGTDSVRIVP